ncbi:MAG: FeoB small GTPase domain-containing protein [Oscillospiraceae bacterium]
MRQHTGNWPGKTVSLAQGVCMYKGEEIRLVDLPGTYAAGQQIAGGDAGGRFHFRRRGRLRDRRM